jgi:hypothetical protein
MGKGARALQVDPNACRELQTFWEGSVEIDVASADYVVATALSSEVWVRGIEAGSTVGGNAITVDHYDILGTGTPEVRTGQVLYMKEGVTKSPMPVITKIYKTGTTATKIRLYYQRKRA